VGVPGVQVESNLQSIKESLESRPGDDIGKQIDTIYDNATGFLEHALDEIRSGENGDRYRIVVFVDDLDRCTPQNGLDVLESIKGLFDINGLIYVLGMNPDTIDSLIEEKYKSRKKTVTGLDYMKKIVQLPFHIPAWSENDIHTLVNDTITRELKGADELQRIFGDAFSIVIQAIEPNPRETKRFINSMALSQAIFDYLPLEELMIVHALRFRQEWNPFLEFITDGSTKKVFFEKYDMLIQYRTDSRVSIEYMAKGLENVFRNKIEISDFEKQPSFTDVNQGAFGLYYNSAKAILQLWPDIEDKYPGFLLFRNPLSKFLLTNYHDQLIKDKLAQINNLEVFRRASGTTSYPPA